MLDGILRRTAVTVATAALATSAAVASAPSAFAGGHDEGKGDKAYSSTGHDKSDAYHHSGYGRDYGGYRGFKTFGYNYFDYKYYGYDASYGQVYPTSPLNITLDLSSLSGYQGHGDEGYDHGKGDHGKDHGGPKGDDGR